MQGSRVHFQMKKTERIVDASLRKVGLREKDINRPQRLVFHDDEFVQMSAEELRSRYGK